MPGDIWKVRGCPSWTLIELCALHRSLILGVSWRESLPDRRQRRRSPKLPAAKLQQDNRVHHVAASSASAGTWKTISNLTKIRPHRHAHTALQFYRPKSAPRSGTLRGISRVPRTPGNVADIAMAVPPAWSRRQTKAAATKLTMPTACANGSNKAQPDMTAMRKTISLASL
jgi:hypothetical protein